MHVISKKMLREFWENPKNANAEGPLLEWYEDVRQAKWQCFADVKQRFNSCDQVGSKTVFNVGGNHYRVIAFIDYERQRVYIRAVLSHKDYDKGNWKNDTFGEDWMPFKKMMQEQFNGKKS